MVTGSEPADRPRWTRRRLAWAAVALAVISAGLLAAGVEAGPYFAGVGAGLVAVAVVALLARRA